ncbi:MAG: hypothetical protein RAO94_02450 [Candidatus Stygibacter australis]|nr:hypothetical protein [Candidatus Stygibacter australis]MDP8321193.1 hypothetical protein [Candidatus Stygibacter australis]
MTGRKHRDVLLELKKKSKDEKSKNKKGNDKVQSSEGFTKSRSTNTKNK